MLLFDPFVNNNVLNATLKYTNSDIIMTLHWVHTVRRRRHNKCDDKQCCHSAVYDISLKSMNYKVN